MQKETHTHSHILICQQTQCLGEKLTHDEMEVRESSQNDIITMMVRILRKVKKRITLILKEYKIMNQNEQI